MENITPKIHKGSTITKSRSPSPTDDPIKDILSQVFVKQHLE
jgi:cellulase/cellobiase CelA1